MATRPDFETLFRAEYPRLVALGVALTGRVEVARDLAQETMARAHAHWDTVEAADSRSAWLRRVMRNLIVDHHRRRDVERRALARLGHPPADAAPERPEVSMAEQLAELPERQRAAIALYYVDDRSVAEIADVLSIAPGTVKALLWKARRTLRRHVTEEDGHE